MLFNPPAGVLALTLMLAVVFMVDGAFEIVFAFELRPYSGWGWMLASGMASVLASVLIAAGWPQVSAVLLGLLLGLNFISSGLAYVTLANALKPAHHMGHARTA